MQVVPEKSGETHSKAINIVTVNTLASVGHHNLLICQRELRVIVEC